MEKGNTRKIKRALISVSDKSGVVDLAKALAEMRVEILSTGGTAGRSRPESDFGLPRRSFK